MNTIDAIAERRSIRRFKDTPVDPETLRCILTAGIQAPSGKNRQPWRFLVVLSEQRAAMMQVMRQGMAASEARGMNPGSAEWTAMVMEHAPVTIFIINPEGIPPWMPHDMGQQFDDVVDMQSSGAAIQNMLLAAQDLGLGTLWICDVFMAYQELMDWLGEKGEMIAAISLGYPDEHPAARSRKPFEEVVRFVGK